MARSVKEWIGKTDDSKPPAAVRLRVFRRFDGVCYLSGAKIQTGQVWDLEHVIPLASVPGKVSGLNRESNLAPALKTAHIIKTAAEAVERSKADRIAKRDLGIVAPKSALAVKPAVKETKREAARTFYNSFQRRPMFVEDAA